MGKFSKKNDPEAKRAGRIAYENGFGLIANPHPEGTIEYNNWRIGWDNCRTRPMNDRKRKASLAELINLTGYGKIKK